MLSSWQQQQYSPYEYAEKWNQFFVLTMIRTEFSEITVLNFSKERKKSLW